MTEYNLFRATVHFLCDIFGKKFKEEYAKALYAQAILETGQFTSQSYRRGHNLFGMKKSAKRLRFWLGTYLGHASYTIDLLSIIDRIHWDVYNRINYDTFSQYVKNVQQMGYAEDEKYQEKWSNIFNQAKYYN